MRDIDFKFTQTDPVADRLRKIYASLASDMEDGSASSEHIHDVRTTIKRLRALWRLVRPIVPAETYDGNNQRLRNGAHGLSPLRDLAVAIEQLENIVKRAASKDARASCAHALEVLAGENATHQPPPDIARSKLKRAAAAMHESRRSFEKLDLENDEWVLIGPGLQRIYRTARERMRTARDSGADQDFHDWRKAAKYHMYHLELLEFTWPGHLAKESERLKDLEQALGEDHDLILLAARLKKERSKLGRDIVSAVLSEIDNRKKSLRKQVLKDGEELFATKPKKLLAKLERHWRKARG